MFIEQPSIYLRWLYPKALWRMDRHQKSVYLTFDDGPIPEATPFTLDVLDRFDIKSTCCMVGDNARKYPHLLDEVRRRGHRIGNHTHNHIGGLRWMSWRYVKNVEEANELLQTNLFRPPHGWMKWSEYIRLGRRYRVVMWDVVTRDYSRWVTAQDVVNNVKRYVRNGSIITFHDSMKSIEKLKSALPESIQWLKEQGYEFKVFE